MYQKKDNGLAYDIIKEFVAKLLGFREWLTVKNQVNLVLCTIF